LSNNKRSLRKNGNGKGALTTTVLGHVEDRILLAIDLNIAVYLFSFVSLEKYTNII